MGGFGQVIAISRMKLNRSFFYAMAKSYLEPPYIFVVSFLATEWYIQSNRNDVYTENTVPGIRADIAKGNNTSNIQKLYFV